MSILKKARNVPSKWLGAFKKGHRYSSREMIDEELSWELLDKIEKSNYTDKASMDALDYIAKFNNEFHKNVVSKIDALHKCTCPNRKKGDKHLEGCHRNSLNDRENAKNRDIMSIGNKELENPKEANSDEDTYDRDDDAGQNMQVFGSKKARYHTPYINQVENAMIDLIDGFSELETDDDTEH